MESLRASLPSRTHFKVLGLGLEASSPRWLEDSTIFWIVKMLLEIATNLAENLRRPCVFLFWRSPEKKFWGLFLFLEIAWNKKCLKTFFGGENTCAYVLAPWPRAFLSLASNIPVLGLEHSRPWPREGLSLKTLSLASDFFMFLTLASRLVSSTSPLVKGLNNLISSTGFQMLKI